MSKFPEWQIVEQVFKRGEECKSCLYLQDDDSCRLLNGEGENGAAWLCEGYDREVARCYRS